MMTSLFPALLLAAVGAPQVDVATLDGQTAQGELAGLDGSKLTLNVDGTPQTWPVRDLLNVEIKQPPEQTPPAPGPGPLLVLVDGTRVTTTTFQTAGGRVEIETSHLQDFAVPLLEVQNIRIAGKDSKVEEAWQKLCQRDVKRDLLVIRKGDALDFIDGLISGIDAKFVRFVLPGDDDPTPIPRDRVFGVIYNRGEPPVRQPVCELTLHGGDFLKVKSVEFDGTRLAATLLSGAAVQLPAGVVRTLDFSLGKLRYLSQMDPVTEEFTPLFGDDQAERNLFRYRRDRALEDQPLRLGDKTYPRGLWIHSKTRLRYRLAKGYRRFEAVMGIDYARARDGAGDVHVEISGDGDTLLEADVRGTDPPRKIELDVSNVNFLEILVDYGGNLNIGDHLDLADAKVIK